MTEKQVKYLKAGDIVREIRTGKETVIEDFTLNEFNGIPIIYLFKQGDDPNYSFALPYYYNELEVVSNSGLCVCDIMVLMRVGCKCGGANLNKA